MTSAVVEVDWVSCFCQVWPGVTYSPSGPLMPAAQLKRQLQQFHSSRANPAGSEMEMPPELRQLQKRHRELSKADNEKLASWYARNPLIARKDLYDLLLESVDAAILPSRLPSSLIGSQEWVRLRPRVRLCDRAGIRDWLENLHSSELANRGVNIGSLFALIEGGGDVGTLGLARLSTRERHPLAKDPRAIGAFFRKNLAPGQPLGFYSGILLSTEALDEWMETLPTFTSTSHQSGMSIDATITARADVKSQADNLCEMHNNPNPNESVKAAFAQDHTVVSKSPVDSFTPHIPQRVELMNMSVQELQRRLLACDVEFDSSGSKIDFVEALLSLPPSKSVYLDTSVLCLHEVLVHMDAEEIMQRLRPIVGCPVITDQKKKNELMQVVVEVAMSNKRVALQKAFPEWLDGTCTGNTTKHSDTVVRALPVPSIDVVSSPTGYPVDDASSLLCKSLVWSYDCAATESSSARHFGTNTYQGAFVRNVLSATNDYHGISDSANIVKVPLLLAGFIPLVMFVTSKAVLKHEEAVMEYGHEWVKTFCKYFPWAKSIFTSRKDGYGTSSDVLISMGLDLKQRTRHGRRGASQEDQVQEAVARLLERESAFNTGDHASEETKSKKRRRSTNSVVTARVSVAVASSSDASACIMPIRAGTSGVTQRDACTEDDSDDDMCDPDCASGCLVHRTPYTLPPPSSHHAVPSSDAGQPRILNETASNDGTATGGAVQLCIDPTAASGTACGDVRQPDELHGQESLISNSEPSVHPTLTINPVVTSNRDNNESPAGHPVSILSSPASVKIRRVVVRAPEYPAGAGHGYSACTMLSHSSHSLLPSSRPGNVTSIPSRKIAVATNRPKRPPASTIYNSVSAAAGRPTKPRVTFGQLAVSGSTMKVASSHPAVVGSNTHVAPTKELTTVIVTESNLPELIASSMTQVTDPPISATDPALSVSTNTIGTVNEAKSSSVIESSESAEVAACTSPPPASTSGKRSTTWLDGRWEYISTEELEQRQAKACGLPTLGELYQLWADESSGGRRTRGSTTSVARSKPGVSVSKSTKKRS